MSILLGIVVKLSHSPTHVLICSCFGGMTELVRLTDFHRFDIATEVA